MDQAIQHSNSTSARRVLMPFKLVHFVQLAVSLPTKILCTFDSRFVCKPQYLQPRYGVCDIIAICSPEYPFLVTLQDNKAESYVLQLIIYSSIDMLWDPPFQPRVPLPSIGPQLTRRIPRHRA